MKNRENRRFLEDLGERMKAARIAKGLSQRAAGKLAWPESEDPQSRVSHYERGTRPIAITDLVVLSSVYGVNPQQLAFGEFSLPEDEENLLHEYRAAQPDTRRIIRAILDTSLETTKVGKKGRARPG